MKSPPLYCEFTRTSLKILAGGGSAEFPLERLPDGRLSAPCRDKLVLALKQFLKTTGCPPHSPSFCGLDARGVSLRCLLLPAVGGLGLEPMVRMQIESEFPLPPDELAWGFRVQGEPQPQPDGTFKQSVLVAALKKELVEQYSEILMAGGMVPVFTLSALARAVLCPHPPAAYAVLELGAGQSELACFDGDSQASVRPLPAAVWSDSASVEALAKAIGNHWHGPKLFILGNADTAAQMACRLPLDVTCEHLHTASDAGASSAILGLKKFAEEQGGVPLNLQLQAAAPARKLAPPALVEWGIRAGILLLAVLLFPVLEALLFMAPLSKTVAAFESRATNVETTVDLDLDFLQTLKQSQPPYLESFYVIAKAAPQGIHVDSLSMNRRGEMDLRGSLRNGDQVAEFRSQLIGSGYFASVTVQEQTPTQDHQKVNIRMTAQWKPLAQLRSVPLGPTPAELGTNAPDGPTNAPPGHAPGPMPPPGVAVTKVPGQGGAH
jgi:hypothetical protein